MGVIAESVSKIILELEDGAVRQGLADTPKRVEAAYAELFAGYKQNPADILKDGFDDIASDGLVMLKDIEFFSMCEHHILPFYGKAHIAYIPSPKGRVLGVSKLARLLDCYAKRLQTQENIGRQVVDALMAWSGKPIGAACILEARHFCICSRGVGKQSSIMVTSALAGVFMDKPQARQELLNLIK